MPYYKALNINPLVHLPPGAGEVVPHGRRLLGRARRVPAEPAQGRRAAELLPGRDAQVPLPALHRRRRHQPRQVGLQRRGARAPYQGTAPLHAPVIITALHLCSVMSQIHRGGAHAR